MYIVGRILENKKKLYFGLYIGEKKTMCIMGCNVSYADDISIYSIRMFLKKNKYSFQVFWEVKHKINLARQKLWSIIGMVAMLVHALNSW